MRIVLLLLLVVACFGYNCIDNSDRVCFKVCREKFPGYKLKESLARDYHMMDYEATRCLCPILLPLGTKISGNRKSINGKVEKVEVEKE